MKAAVLYEPRKPLVIEDLKLAPPEDRRGAGKGRRQRRLP